jgi:hypothetical protein
MISRFVTLAAVALCIGGASVATTADPQTPAPTPTPIDLPTLPPSTQINPYVKLGIDIVTGIVKQRLAINPNASSGQVTYFKRFEMQVRTGANSYRSVHLHQGTVINPRGASIQTGQRVEIAGLAQNDGSLNADTITISQ